MACEHAAALRNARGGTRAHAVEAHLEAVLRPERREPEEGHVGEKARTWGAFCSARDEAGNGRRPRSR